jgi:hypothetical protein
LAQPGSLACAVSAADAVVMAAGAMNIAAATAVTQTLRSPVMKCPFPEIAADGPIRRRTPKTL